MKRWPKNFSLDITFQPWQEIDDATVGDLYRLEDEALLANAYLSPGFIFPALEHLKHGASVVLAKAVHDSQLVGAVFLQLSKRSRSVPFFHLELYRSKHSPMAGFVLHQDYADWVLPKMLDAIFTWQRSCRVVEIVQMQEDDVWNRFLQRDNGDRINKWTEYEGYNRRIFRPKFGGDEYIHNFFSKKLRHDLARTRNRLAELGKMEWRVVRGESEWHSHIQRFLELENLGWKGQQKTSLLCNPNDLCFFNKLVANFTRNQRLFLTELLLDGQIIATTINLVSKSTGFGFKLAWDPRFAKYSPSILNIVELIRQGPDQLADLEYIDSASLPGSYIEHLFKDSITIISGSLTRRDLATFVIHRIQNVRSAMARLRSDRSLKVSPA